MDERFIQRTLALAAKGRGHTKTNPMVGAVLVRDGRILAEGYHRAYGADHAEVDCLRRAKEDPAGATLYVNLEPCSHHGKTPPCVDAIVRAKIARVVVGMEDPNPKVAGGGIARLRQSGVEVTTGVLEAECEHLNRAFITGITKHRPYILAKYAATVDGRIATRSGESQWITGEAARKDGHRLRGEVDGILVGTRTALLDDPRLTNRSGEGKQPVRIVLDRMGRLDAGAKLFDGEIETVVYTARMDRKKADRLAEQGVAVVFTEERDGVLDTASFLEDLYDRGVGTLLVEGGGTLHGSMIKGDFVDEFVLYLAPTLLGGGREAVRGEGVEFLKDRREYVFTEVERCGSDLKIRGVRACLQES